MVPWFLLTLASCVGLGKLYGLVHPVAAFRILPDTIGSILISLGSLFAWLGPSMIMANLLVATVRPQAEQSVQLRAFGAQAYVADLVSVAMTREMGAMMTAIVMAGRTGAAFAAELGTMQVNDEIDALTTFGVPPMEFLVLPRMVALAVMMPLLCLYADLLGFLGGAAVGVGLLQLGGLEYYQRSVQAIRLDDFAAGLIKASVFGVLVAIAGCLRGMQSERSSGAVGAATTSVVVLLPSMLGAPTSVESARLFSRETSFTGTWSGAFTTGIS